MGYNVKERLGEVSCLLLSCKEAHATALRNVQRRSLFPSPSPDSVTCGSFGIGSGGSGLEGGSGRGAPNATGCCSETEREGAPGRDGRKRKRKNGEEA